jgi:hypothetical protein
MVLFVFLAGSKPAWHCPADARLMLPWRHRIASRDRMYSATIATTRYVFPDLKALLAKASPQRSGDMLAGIAA